MALLQSWRRYSSSTYWCCSSCCYSSYVWSTSHSWWELYCWLWLQLIARRAKKKKYWPIHVYRIQMIYATDFFFCCDYIRAVSRLIPSPAWVNCIVVCAKCQPLPSVLVEVGRWWRCGGASCVCVALVILCRPSRNDSILNVSKRAKQAAIMFRSRQVH